MAPLELLVRLSALRDRTEINRLVVEALALALQAEEVALHAVAERANGALCLPLVHWAGGTVVLADAYSLSSRQGRPLASLPGMQTCLERDAYHPELQANGLWRCHWPIPQQEHTAMILVASCRIPPTPECLTLLDGALCYLGHHLDLLDYAETDTLTGLYNRKTFEENLSRVLVEADHCRQLGYALQSGNDAAEGDGTAHSPATSTLSAAFTPSSGVAESTEAPCNWLGVIDIDHFKVINDTWGHIYGDEVLLLVAQLMRDAFRFEDRLFRFGGEEFVVILQATRRHHAQKVFDRFRRRIAAHLFPQVGHITLSIGYTRIDPLDTPTELVGRADEALYFVKEHGRNGSRCYETLVEAGHLHRTQPVETEVELF